MSDGEKIWPYYLHLPNYLIELTRTLIVFISVNCIQFCPSPQHLLAVSHCFLNWRGIIC